LTGTRTFALSDVGKPVGQRDVATAREAPTAEADPEARPARTRGAAERSRGAGVAAALAVATGSLARLVRLVAGVLAGIIALGILLVVLKANPDNSIASAVHDTARALVGPFKGMFKLDDARAAVAVNWGIAAIVYLILGALIAWLISLIGITALRSRRAAAR
jgi:hypothetical protein